VFVLIEITDNQSLLFIAEPFSSIELVGSNGNTHDHWSDRQVVFIRNTRRDTSENLLAHLSSLVIFPKIVRRQPNINLVTSIDLVLIDQQSVGKRSLHLMGIVNAKKRWTTIYWRVNKSLKESHIVTRLVKERASFLKLMN
jgi:hypothetical protein